MEITDLPDYIDITLSEAEAIPYPQDGEIVKAFQIRLHCFTAKQYVSTWPLRSRIMESTSKIASLFPQTAINHQLQIDEEEAKANKTMDPQQFKQMMLMSSFDLMAGFEDFKNLAIAGKLVELDEGIHINRERWDQVCGTAQEKLFFGYVATFILPCVL